MFAKPDDNNDVIEVTVETDESSKDDEEEEVTKFNPLYAYLVLFLVLVARIIVMWHRAGLSYAYGYAGVGA